MYAMMDATKRECDDRTIVVDEYGDEWDVIADDGNGHLAVERDAGERWECGEFSDGTLYVAGQDGGTFGVSCRDEYIVRRVDGAGSLRWAENV